MRSHLADYQPTTEVGSILQFDHGGDSIGGDDRHLMSASSVTLGKLSTNMPHEYAIGKGAAVHRFTSFVGVAGRADDGTEAGLALVARSSAGIKL